MRAMFSPCQLNGSIAAPPSKSMAHRYLIGAALAQGTSVITGVDYSDDILATIDCLRALGACVQTEGDVVTVDAAQFMHPIERMLPCRESGSTLRFFVPLALCLGQEMTLCGSERLLQRPLDEYERLCRENGFVFEKRPEGITLCGELKSGAYALRGDVSSQFVTGLLLALVYLGEDASIRIMPPFESRSYVQLTVRALRAFGAKVSFSDDYTLTIQASRLHPIRVGVEGDYSHAALLDAFNAIGSRVQVENLVADSLQGDKIYKEYFAALERGTPTLDISDCPDLGPVLIALAALKNGAVLTGTDRLKGKESDRGHAMHEELQKLGGGLVFGDNTITIPPQKLRPGALPLDGHNDHRVVMALSVILSTCGGSVEGAEAVRKSYPSFFEDIRSLGADVTLD